MSQLDSLSKKQRELLRPLDLFLSGPRRDEMWRDELARARAGQDSLNRRTHAWMFFHPDPAKVVLPEPPARTKHRHPACGGCGLACLVRRTGRVPRPGTGRAGRRARPAVLCGRPDGEHRRLPRPIWNAPTNGTLATRLSPQSSLMTSTLKISSNGSANCSTSTTQSTSRLRPTAGSGRTPALMPASSTKTRSPRSAVPTGTPPTRLPG